MPHVCVGDVKLYSTVCASTGAIADTYKYCNVKHKRWAFRVSFSHSKQLVSHLLVDPLFTYGMLADNSDMISSLIK